MFEYPIESLDVFLFLLLAKVLFSLFHLLLRAGCGSLLNNFKDNDDQEGRFMLLSQVLDITNDGIHSIRMGYLKERL
jgi:hypothetical protein